MSTKNGVELAIEAAGGQVRLAESLGVSQQAISNWLRQGYVPSGRVIEIEARYGVPRAKLINPRLANLVDLPTESEGGEL